MRRPDETLDEAVANMFERARRNGVSAPRKHHLLPASYLERWVVDERIRVTETDSRNTYVTRPDRAARVTDFYSLASDQLDNKKIPPLLIETILSQIEGDAKQIIDKLIEGGPRALTLIEALAFEQFLAFQIVRGRMFREQLAEAADRTEFALWSGISDEGIAAHLSEQGIENDPDEVAYIRGFISEWRAGQIRVQPQGPAMVGLAAEAAIRMSGVLLARTWKIYHSSVPLITCDEPVVAVPGPRGDRRRYAGLQTAGVILFPLDPYHLLVMFHPALSLDVEALRPELSQIETGEINWELAANSERWLFERSDRKRTLSLRVPPLPEVRVTMTEYNVANDPLGSLVVVERPTRWANSTVAPPSPISRWWQNAQVPDPCDAPFEPSRMHYANFTVLE